MSFFAIWTLQSAVTCESGRAPSRKSVCFDISKLILYFFIFHLPCTVLFTVYFHTVISVFRTSIYAFFVIDRTRKKTLIIKLFDFVFTKALSSISQSNVEAVKAEKEEQYTLSNMICIKLPKCCFHALRSILKFLKRRQTN